MEKALTEECAMNKDLQEQSYETLLSSGTAFWKLLLHVIHPLLTGLKQPHLSFTDPGGAAEPQAVQAADSENISNSKGMN